MIGKRTNALIVLGIAFVKHMHFQLIRPDQFKSLVSVTVALRQFHMNPQPGLSKFGPSKVKQFAIISFGMGFPRSRPIVFQVDIIGISSFDKRSRLDDLLVYHDILRLRIDSLIFWDQVIYNQVQDGLLVKPRIENQWSLNSL